MFLAHNRCCQTVKPTIAAQIANNTFFIYELLQCITQSIPDFIDVLNIVMSTKCNNHTDTPCAKYSVPQNHRIVQEQGL